MQKNYLIIGAVAIGMIVIAAGGFFFLNQSKSSEDAMMEEKMAEDLMQEDNSNSGDEAMMEEDQMMSDESRYIVYNSGSLDENSDSKRVLYFYANWCPICRPVDTELRENSDQIPEDIRIIRVNYSDPDTDAEEEALADKYAITYQHTFVQIDENGNEITKWSGGGLDEILENVQ